MNKVIKYITGTHGKSVGSRHTDLIPVVISSLSNLQRQSVFLVLKNQFGHSTGGMTEGLGNGLWNLSHLGHWLIWDCHWGRLEKQQLLPCKNCQILWNENMVSIPVDIFSILFLNYDWLLKSKHHTHTHLINTFYLFLANILVMV